MTGRYDDVNPQDIDPETNEPYRDYSSPALDTSFHDGEMDVGDDDDDLGFEPCMSCPWPASCAGNEQCEADA